LELKLKKEGKEVGGRAGTHRLLRLEHRSTVTLAAVSMNSNDALSTLYISLSKKKPVLEFNPDDRQHSVTKWSYFIN
jgi:hypothetical protein